METCVGPRICSGDVGAVVVSRGAAVCGCDVTATDGDGDVTAIDGDGVTSSGVCAVDGEDDAPTVDGDVVTSTDVSAVDGDCDSFKSTCVGSSVICSMKMQLSGTTNVSVPRSVNDPPSNSNTVVRGEFEALPSRTSIMTRPPANPLPLASSIVTL
jgi:hypothetical protein